MILFYVVEKADSSYTTSVTTAWNLEIIFNMAIDICMFQPPHTFSASGDASATLHILHQLLNTYVYTASSQALHYNSKYKS